MNLERFPTAEERYPGRGEPLPSETNEEHLWCGTPDCCQQCDTAEPIQLELNFENNTQQKIND